MCIRDRSSSLQDATKAKIAVAATTSAASGSTLSLIHISEPTRQAEISYAVFCLKKKKEPARAQCPAAAAGGSRGVVVVVCFFFNDTATTEIYTRSLVGSVRCV